MKIAVRGGHNYFVLGANGIVNEVTEDRKIYTKVIEYLKKLGHEILDVTPGRTATSLEDLMYGASKANEWGADYFCSIHLNAFNGVAKGTEVLYKSTKGKEYADRIVAKLADLGFMNRGSKLDTRGLYEFKYVNAPNNIIECFFCDNAEDVSLYNTVGVDAIARAIAEGIAGQTIQGKYYVVTNYLPATEYGVEFNTLYQKYFTGTGRIYLKSNDKGIWLETQYLSKEAAQVLADKLKQDNLLYEMVVE